MQLFLENNIPRTKKSKQPVVLGVADPDLAEVISDKLDIKCLSSGLVTEITRGILLGYLNVFFLILLLCHKVPCSSPHT